MTMLADGCLEKYAKKLLRKTEIEDALKKLDRLTQEEARMAAAEHLRLTHTVDKKVEAVADTVIVIDNRVAGVDDRVADVVDQVASVDDRVVRVDERVAGVVDQVAGVDDRVQQTATDIDEMKRLSTFIFIRAGCRALLIPLGNQYRENIHKWLSPPDPSTNHNIACGTHHKKTATWFFEGRIFREWKSTGSFLWVHGKRVPHPLYNLSPSNSISYCSWFGKKRDMVRDF